jgi:hypothetical protein
MIINRLIKIKHFVISLTAMILLISCEKTTNEINISIDRSITLSDLNNEFIQLIPGKGLKIENDSILLINCVVSRLFNLFDTTSIEYNIKFSGPRIGFISEKNDTVNDMYSAEYFGNISIDKFYFHFEFSNSVKDPYKLNLDSLLNLYIDSLKLEEVRVFERTNIGLYDDLRIGDTVTNIYKYYEKPDYSNTCRQDRLPSWHYYDGVIIIAETDSSKPNVFGKIIAIEINNKEYE